jgi:4-hydroxy-tetrahydrodipicolinate synthase
VNPLTGGVVVPAITPLTADGRVDVASLTRLIRTFEAAGTRGVLVLGSTGEGPFLSPAECEQVVGTAAAASDLPIVANVAALSTADAVAAAKRAGSAGASVILAPPPSGFPLSQVEMAWHYEQIAGATSLPTYAYHVPVRTPSALAPKTLGKLVRDGVLAGVKDSSGDLDNHRREARELAGTNALLFTGSETCIDLAIQLGFQGSVPGLANVYPHAEVELVDLALAGKLAEAHAAQDTIVDMSNLYFAPLNGATFSAVAVGALKFALVQAGIIESATLRRPFATPDVSEHVLAHLREFPVHNWT